MGGVTNMIPRLRKQTRWSGCPVPKWVQSWHRLYEEASSGVLSLCRDKEITYISKVLLITSYKTDILRLTYSCQASISDTLAFSKLHLI